MSNRQVTSKNGFSDDVVELLSSKKLASMNAQELFVERQSQAEKYVLKTHLFVLDAYLRGGIPPDGITEIVGASGVGKSQMCYMLSVLATLPEDAGGLGTNCSVLYLVSENTFAPTRLIELCSSLAPQYFCNYDRIAQALNRIVCVQISNSQQFLSALNNVDDEIISKRVKVLIVDSIAAVIQKEFDNSNLSRRQHLLNHIASRLKIIAASYHIPIVVTNLVIPISSGHKQSMNHRQLSISALGTVWSHCVNTRIVLEYSTAADFNISDNIVPALIRISTTSETQLPDEEPECPVGSLRCLTIAKSPVSPVVSFPCVITKRGLCLLKVPELILSERSVTNPSIDDFVLDIDPSNYWDQIISMPPDLELTKKENYF
ncbi:DNA repair protein RAD51 homolog 2-like [Schistocerca gregaria]|uniref:DNA repair protein RAD51 homolog 2-like n=1 Tax=Schistocerca gregaria TaxID=7010 RepID=UPI00211F35EA|nr:DNA repair protein RAD51 homolog 2-like [Schistocerca gregaria]